MYKDEPRPAESPGKEMPDSRPGLVSRDNDLTDDAYFSAPEPVELPIDGILDLHAFHPRDVNELVPDYLSACRERGILQVRIIHGKGKGILRQRVHSLLRKLEEVDSFRLAGEDEGGWGATIVSLRPLNEASAC